MRENNFLDKLKKVLWILTPFILIAIIIILLMKHYESEKECFDCDDLEERIDNIGLKIKDKDCVDCDWENIDGEEVQKPTENDTIIDGEEVQKPTANCRAHFSGLFFSDDYESETRSKIWVIDESSEYVGEGEYPRAINAFPRAHQATFDGIAIDKNTRVIIYSEENFKGDILLNESGPSIILNSFRMNDYSELINEILSKEFRGPLNSNYPTSCRKLSESNMIKWSQGSLKIICNE